jgi:putative PIN family toxin of toxin-antitoxin system
MIVVIDTNVFVSAVLRDSLPRQVLEMVIEREDCYWMATPELLAEYESVIRRPRLGIPPDAQEEWRRLTRNECFLIETRVPALDFPRDRKDIHVLHAAAVAEADYLITGDRDFSEAHGLIPSRIVSAREFAYLHGIG